MGRLIGGHRSSASRAGRFKKSLSLPLETLGRDKAQQSLLRSFTAMRCSPKDPDANHGSREGGDHDHIGCDIIDDPVHKSETLQRGRRRCGSKRIPHADHGGRQDCSFTTATGTPPPTTIDCSFTTGTGTSPPTTISPRQAAPSLANTPVAPVVRGTPSVSIEDSPAPGLPKPSVHEGNQNRGFRRSVSNGGAPAPIIANTPVAPVVRGTPSVSIEDSPTPSLPKASVHEGSQNRGFRRSVSSGKAPAPIIAKASVDEGNQRKGLRREYNLGDKGRSSDMITEPTDERALEAVASLENFDFAFLKRSNGSFSYAILAYRSMEPITRDNRTSLVECMNFITCDVGGTKKVAKHNWGKYVRRVSKEGVSPTNPVEDVLSSQNLPVGVPKEGVSPKHPRAEVLSPRKPPVRHISKEGLSPELEEALRQENTPPICAITCTLHLEDSSTISSVSEPEAPRSKRSTLGKGHSRSKVNGAAHRTEKKSKETAPSRRSIRGFVRWNSK